MSAAAEESLSSYNLLSALTSSSQDGTATSDLVHLLESLPEPTAGAHKPTPLHLAVRCAKTNIFHTVLAHRHCDINAQDAAGQTPLHIASTLGRAELVSLLLAQPSANDAVIDDSGRSCLDCAATPEVSRLIQTSHSTLNAHYLEHLAAYVSSGQAEGLVTMLKSPRASGIDFAARTPSPSSSSSSSQGYGTTLMHEAAKRKDIDLLQLAHSRGADVLVRDSRGKPPMDLVKDDKVKAWFRQTMSAEDRALRTQASTAESNSTNYDNAALMHNSSYAPPPRRGYLQKWTNLARGYKNRWFVLQNGQLSYYRHQSEEGKASRGTIAMGHARVSGPSSSSQGDANKFEISSEVAKFRFFVKADHPLEAIRWSEDLKAHIDYASGTLTRRPSSAEGNGVSNSNSSSSASSIAGGASKGRLQPMSSLDSSRDSKPPNSVEPPLASPNVIPPTPTKPEQSSSSSTAVADDASETNPSSSVTNLTSAVNRRLSSSTFRKLIPGSGQRQSSTNSNLASRLGSVNGSSVSVARSNDGSQESSSIPQVSSSPSSIRPADDPDSASLVSFGNEGQGDSKRKPPHEEHFMLLANSAQAQLETTRQLAESLKADSSASSDKHGDVCTALGASMKRLDTMLHEYIDQVAEREQWFIRRHESEVEARRMWEDNLAHLAHQQSQLEEELQREALKGSRRKRELKNLQSRGSEKNLSAAGHQEDVPEEPESVQDGSDAHHGRDRSDTIRPMAAGAAAAGAATAGAAGVAASSKSQKQQQQDSQQAAYESDSDSDDEEFFEAVDSGQLSMSVDPPLEEPPSAVFHEKDLPEGLRQQVAEKDLVYAGYKEPRKELPIGVDNRPNVSLWSILKNSIGKDLTKISFPVSFNEPTSMLQRMAEDMEFSEVLDAGIMHKDPLERIGFVAAFAMSNYSSTIGRIAKPFNPMLGETFEYVSIDKRYRYMSEQVSHHPPISACIAESPNYRYYGEVDAKNKFYGKSFEIRPTGVAHCELRLPAESAPGYPTDNFGFATEHYSWKKVTSSVSNFIWGSPIIDHYGDMVVTNHRTGDTCLLTFKPRGWKGANSSEIWGKVKDKEGKTHWEIAGRWSTQLVARRAGSGAGELQPDTSVSDGAQQKSEYILLWKNSEKPPNQPFNLTPYAITLNGKDERLVPWLPPTDCRLRPDLHAFEAGRFDEANELKIGLEDLQRSTRRKREVGELPPHHARWFSRKTESDTHEGYWEPSRCGDGSLEYWSERERVGRAKTSGQDAEWKDVSPIFGDFALLEVPDNAK